MRQGCLGLSLETDGGTSLKLVTYGATILRYVTPDKDGNFANVILGFDDFASYVAIVQAWSKCRSCSGPYCRCDI